MPDVCVVSGDQANVAYKMRRYAGHVSVTDVSPDTVGRPIVGEDRNSMTRRMVSHIYSLVVASALGGLIGLLVIKGL